MGNGNHRPGRTLRHKLLTIAGVLCLAGELAYANPTGPAVANGQVGFSTAGNVLTVTNSPGSIINWQSFSIGSNEVTRFLQQSSASSVLNRVSGINPSTILGALQSNGRVFLINPSGIMFGANAQIDVAGLVASTLNLSDADFLAGRFRFTDMPGAAGIANQGSITTTAGGMVYLVAPDIQNSGIIKTPQGEILLAAGKSVELVDAQTPEVRVQISAPDNQALNLGQLIAEGGRIGIYAGLIQHGGVANANTAVVGENGKIVFRATKDVTLDAGSQMTANGPQGGSVTVQSDTGTTLVSGAVEAKGTGGKGGTVRILGNQVGLIDNATVDASGQTGGGTVLVGGDRHGDNSDIQNAWRTYFGSNASVKADAVASGDGGKVIVWSDDVTRYYGSISARGGVQEGDGGFAEVSGKGYLDYRGLTNLRAPNGTVGTLLLDPDSVDITTTVNSANMTAATPFASNDANPSTVTWAMLEGALGGGTVIVQTTTGNINIANSYNFSTNNTATGILELLSGANITAASGQTVTGKAGLSLWLNAAGTTTLDTNFANFADVNFTNGLASTYSGLLSGAGTLTKAGAGTLALSGANTYSGGTTISAGALQGDTTSLQGNITDNASVVFDQTAAGTYASVISGTGAVTKQNTGNVTFSGTNTYSGGTTISGGTLTLGHATDTLADSGAINVNGGTLAIGANSDTVGAVTLTSGSITGSTGVLTGTGYDVQDGSIGAILGGSGALTKSTSGTVVLSGANSYTGATSINAGTLAVTADQALGTSAAGTTVASGSTLDFRNVNYATTEALTVNGGAVSTSTGTSSVAGVVALGADSTVDVGGTRLTLSGVVSDGGGGFGISKTSAGTLVLSGANTYTGVTNVNAGTLKLAGGIAIADTAAVSLANVAGVTLDLNGSNETIGSLAGGGTTGGIVTNGVGAGSTLTTGDATNTTFSGVIQDGAGTVALTKQGGGIFTLAGANTYTGATTINAGTLSVATIGNGGVAGNLGAATNVAANLVLGGGTLQYTGATASTDRAFTLANSTTSSIDVTTNNLTISGASVATTGALIKIGAGTLTLSGANLHTGLTTVNAGTLAYGVSDALASGAVTVSGNTAVLALGTNSDAVGTVTVANGGTITGSGALTSTGTFEMQDGSVSAILSGTGTALNKTTSGTVTLSGANAYTGTTSVNAGVLNLQNDMAAGTGAVAVTNGAAVQVQGGITVANALTLNGTGVSNDGALRNISGNNTWSGAITDGSASRINSDSGTLTLTGGVDNGGALLTVGGAGATTVNTAAISGTGGLTKDGAGTLTLGFGNTYTGLTTVTAGTLALGTNDVLADASALAVSGGVFDFGGFSDTVNGVQLTGGTIQNGTLTSATDYDVQVGAVSAVLAGTVGLNKSGSGTVALSGANTYTGTTTISGGTLAVSGAGGTAGTGTIAVGTNTLDIINGGTVTNAVTINGGTITNSAGAGTLSTGGVTLGGNSNVSSTASGLTISAVITGGFGLASTGTGTVTLGGVNTYTGATTINGGSTLALNTVGTIADSSGVANSGTFTIAADKTIDSMTGAGATTLGGSTLTIGDASNTSGTYSGVVSGTGGIATAGTGTLTLGGANLYTGATTIGAGSTLALNGTGTIADSSGVANAGTFTIAAAKTIDSMTGAGTTTLGANTLTIGDASNMSGTYSGVVSGTGGITKAGTGTLTLSGANTYSGATTVNAGVVAAQNDTALGAASGATTVASGASVQIDGTGLTIAELITLTGTGTGTEGALRNLANDNTWSGAITLGAGGARINSDAGMLTIATGGISGATQPLTVGGAGNATISAIIGTTSGTLTKDGAGTLTLSGANTYDGITSITAGTVIAAANNALGSTAGNTTVSSGATIGFSNGIAYNAAETIVLNGTGDAGNSRAGALDNISGTNSFAGTLTLVGGGDSAIGATAGSFTHSGSTVGASDLTYNPASGTTITESGVVSGVGTNVIKNGAGTLVLSGANTYNGNTTLNTGTLRATTSAAALGAGSLTLAGGTLELANDSGLNFGRNTTVTGNSTIVSDRLTSGAGVTHTLGTLSIGAQTLAVNAGTNVTSGTAGLNFGATTLTGGATFSVGSGALLTLGNVSGAGQALTVDGAGSTNFSGTVGAASVALNNTAGTVSFQDNVTITTGLTTAANAFNVSFTGDNNNIAGTTAFNNTGTLTLGDQNIDSTTFVGGVTATAPASKNIAGTVAASGTGAINLGTSAVSVTDSATVGDAGTGAITLGNATLADGKQLTVGTGVNNAINLGSVLGNAGVGTETLIINTTGVANVAGAVGATGNALDQLTITQSGGTTFAGTVDAKNVTTTDTAASQTVAFQNGVTATNLTVGAGTGAYNVSLLGSGDVITNAVTFNNTGTLALGQAGGTQTYNGGITATAPSSTTLKGTIATSDDALVFGPVTLGANTILNSGTGAVSFGGTVDADLAGNNRTLTINSTGTTVLGGAVGGAQALASLTTNAGGTTQINGGAVTITAAQTYNDTVTLGANTTLTGANVSFNNTLNSGGTNYALTVNDSGTTTFGGAVGNTLALSSITTDAAGTTAINGGSVTTTGTQTYNDAVTLNADATLASAASGDVTFASALNSLGATARSLTVNSGGVTTFGGTVGGSNALATLTADATGSTAVNGGAVTTTGAQTYNDAVTLGADTTFNGVNIAFNNTLNSSGTNRTLTVNDGGTTTFGGVVGGALALSSITTDAPGAAAVNGGSVTTTGGQTYNDAVTLGANATFNGVNIAFNNTLNSSGTSRTLTVNDSGTTTFGGAVGGSLALTSLATDAGGTTAINAGSLTTTGVQTYNDAVTVGTNTALNAGSANIIFASTVNGPAGLTVNSTGATTFNATAGGVTALASVVTDAGGTTSLQDVTTTGAQSYGDNVVLKSIYNTGNGAFSVGGTTAFSVASTAINTGSGDITFTGPINGANNLTLTNTGITTFSSPVGGTTPLTTLTATAGNFVMPASVTTTGNITMTGAGSYSVPSITTTSGGNVALTSTGGALSVNAASAAAGGDVTLTADEIELTGAANSIIGSVNLRLQPQNVSQAIEIGGLGGTGALDITNNEITKIATGFPNITIGRTAGTGAVSFNTSSFNDHLTVIGGSIAANGALTAAGKTITLTANSGGISSTGAGVNVVANALNANAVGNITLNTRVDTINAASSAGGITLVETDGATLANVTAPAGDVDITATTGNLALDTVTAGTTNNKFALLFAPNGTITDANGSAVNVTAANIELVARDGIDLDTKAFNSDFTTANFPALQPSRLNAGTITAVNTGIADIDIRQVGNADILNVATASDQTTSGNITISGTDSLAVNTVSAGGLVYFGTAPSITTKSVGGNMLITLNSPRASAGLSDPTVTLAGGGLVPVSDTGRDGGPGKVAVIERFVAPSGAVDYQITGTGTGDNRFTLVVAGQVPIVGGTIKITAPGAITDYTGMPPDASEVINVLNLVGQTIEVSGFTSSLAYQLVTDGSGLEGFSPEQTLPASVAQLVQQIAASQRSTQDKENQKKQEALAGRVCR